MKHVRGEEEYRVWWWKHEGRNPLLKSRHILEDNIKFDLKEKREENTDCKNLAQGPVAGCCGQCNRILALIKCSEFVD